MNRTRSGPFGVPLRRGCVNVCLFGGVFSVGGGRYLCAILNGRLLNTPITCFAICCCHGADYVTPPRAAARSSSQMPARSYLWSRYLREPKYVCADFCIRASACPAMGARAWAFCADWKHRWDAWHKQGRAVGGWCQGLTPTTRRDTLSDSWESAGSRPTGKVSASIGRSLDALIFQRPPFAPPFDAHTCALLSRWSPERHCGPFTR